MYKFLTAYKINGRQAYNKRTDFYWSLRNSVQKYLLKLVLKLNIIKNITKRFCRWLGVIVIESVHHKGVFKMLYIITMIKFVILLSFALQVQLVFCKDFSKLEAVVKQAETFQQFIQNQKLLAEYRDALNDFYGMEMDRKIFDAFIYQASKACDKWPEFCERLWEELPAPKNYFLKSGIDSLGRSLDYESFENWLYLKQYELHQTGATIYAIKNIEEREAKIKNTLKELQQEKSKFEATLHGLSNKQAGEARGRYFKQYNSDPRVRSLAAYFLNEKLLSPECRKYFETKDADVVLYLINELKNGKSVFWDKDRHEFQSILSQIVDLVPNRKELLDDKKTFPVVTTVTNQGKIVPIGEGADKIDFIQSPRKLHTIFKGARLKECVGGKCVDDLMIRRWAISLLSGAENHFLFNKDSYLGFIQLVPVVEKDNPNSAGKVFASIDYGTSALERSFNTVKNNEPVVQSLYDEWIKYANDHFLKENGWAGIVLGDNWSVNNAGFMGYARNHSSFSHEKDISDLGKIEPLDNTFSKQIVDAGRAIEEKSNLKYGKDLVYTGSLSMSNTILETDSSKLIARLKILKNSINAEDDLDNIFSKVVEIRNRHNVKESSQEITLLVDDIIKQFSEKYLRKTLIDKKNFQVDRINKYVEDFIFSNKDRPNDTYRKACENHFFSALKKNASLEQTVEIMEKGIRPYEDYFLPNKETMHETLKSMTEYFFQVLIDNPSEESFIAFSRVFVSKLYFVFEKKEGVQETYINIFKKYFSIKSVDSIIRGLDHIVFVAREKSKGFLFMICNAIEESATDDFFNDLSIYKNKNNMINFFIDYFNNGNFTLSMAKKIINYMDKNNFKILTETEMLFLKEIMKRYSEELSGSSMRNESIVMDVINRMYRSNNASLFTYYAKHILVNDKFYNNHQDEYERFIKDVLEKKRISLITDCLNYNIFTDACKRSEHLCKTILAEIKLINNVKINQLLASKFYPQLELIIRDSGSRELISLMDKSNEEVFNNQMERIQKILDSNNSKDISDFIKYELSIMKSPDSLMIHNYTLLRLSPEYYIDYQEFVFSALVRSKASPKLDVHDIAISWLKKIDEIDDRRLSIKLKINIMDHLQLLKKENDIDIHQLFMDGFLKIDESELENIFLIQRDFWQKISSNQNILDMYLKKMLESENNSVIMFGIKEVIPFRKSKTMDSLLINYLAKLASFKDVELCERVSRYENLLKLKREERNAVQNIIRLGLDQNWEGMLDTIKDQANDLGMPLDEIMSLPDGLRCTEIIDKII